MYADLYIRLTTTIVTFILLCMATKFGVYNDKKTNYYRRKIRPSYFQPPIWCLISIWFLFLGISYYFWHVLTEKEFKDGEDITYAIDMYMYMAMGTVILWSILILLSAFGYLNPIFTYFVTSFLVIFILMLIPSIAITSTVSIVWENDYIRKRLLNLFLTVLSACIWFLIIIDNTHIQNIK